MQNAKVNKAQAGIKIAGRNINNLRYADVHYIMHYYFKTPNVFLSRRNSLLKA